MTVLRKCLRVTYVDIYHKLIFHNIFETRYRITEMERRLENQSEPANQ
jgi:hypothetical protein